ncbi:MAG: ParB/RepB/Spo0J family partition protein [Oscillospiraceae bacterium]|nr:ParB/RepB/Spo0J family partition protein [Oscillospiraceae bacterium]
MAKKQMGLGRGLDELFGSVEPEESVAPSELDINLIEPSREQPRKSFPEEELVSLSESIGIHGVITPITVRKISENRYRIIAGERRYRASRMAGLKKLPVHIVEADELRAMELGLVENLQRQDLNPVEEAEGIRTLIERYGMSQEEASERLSRSRPAVTNALRLLDLPEKVKEMLSKGILSAGHGRTLAAIEEEKLCILAAEKVIAEKLSVRQTEALVKKLKAEPKQPKKPTGDGVDYAAELSRKLSETMGREVKISMGRGNSGRVTLNFSNLDDLDRLLALLEK